MLTFKNFQSIISDRTVKLGKTTDWVLSDWTNALAGEVGEACNFAKKLRRGDDNQEELKLGLGKELADIISYAFLVASYIDMDLETLVIDKFNEVSDKWELGIKL